jgi:thiamine biosynthesis lipoprotein
LGTTAVVLVADERQLGLAREHVEREIAAVDIACSRFREDSELTALNRAGTAIVSELMLEAITVALVAAHATDGLVDPTLGTSMQALGYDRDFASVPPTGPPLVFELPRRAAWQQVIVDRSRRTVALPPGVQLDLGATAKAWCADRAAAAAAGATGGGVLVSLGGDLGVVGTPPPEGWVVRVTDDHSADPEESDGPVVTLHDGGLATSGTANRHWCRGDDALHHVLDPQTGRPVPAYWRTATVAAASCLAANTASTAAMVLGPDAPDWLDHHGLPARLVRDHGEVVHVGSWPAELEEATCSPR